MNILTILSLLLFVVTCAMWIESYRHPHFFTIHTAVQDRWKDWTVSFSDGHIFFARFFVYPSGKVFPNPTTHHIDEFSNFMVFSLILPTIWLIALRTKRKRLGRAGKTCANCGYDLRATPQRCPECGMETTTAILPTR